jgi:hypothetical protein
VEERTFTSGVLVKKQGEVIGGEPGNTIQDPDASDKAVSKSDGCPQGWPFEFPVGRVPPHVGVRS